MKRAVTALILIPTVGWVALLSPEPIWMAVTAIVAALCFYEFRSIAAAHGSHFPLACGLLAGLAILLVPGRAFVALPAVIAAVSLALAMRSDDLARVLPNCAGLMLGLFYIFGSWRSSLELGRINRHWLLFAMALNWIGDMAAYFVGRAIGRHKLAPIISPGKSWEGATASVLGSAIFGVVYLGYFLPGVGTAEAFALTAVANVAGQLGDLSESALKRGAGMKDSGSSLPGHGGWLDRVDSTLFAVPFVFLWLTIRTGRY